MSGFSQENRQKRAEKRLKAEETEACDSLSRASFEASTADINSTGYNAQVELTCPVADSTSQDAGASEQGNCAPVISEEDSKRIRFAEEPEVMVFKEESVEQDEIGLDAVVTPDNSQDVSGTDIYGTSVPESNQVCVTSCSSVLF